MSKKMSAAVIGATLYCALQLGPALAATDLPEGQKAEARVETDAPVGSWRWRWSQGPKWIQENEDEKARLNAQGFTQYAQ